GQRRTGQGCLSRRRHRGVASRHRGRRGCSQPGDRQALPGLRALLRGPAGRRRGGLASFRQGGGEGEGIHTYQEMVLTVGEDNIIFVPYEVIPKDEISSFQDRFYGYMGQ